MKGNEDLKVPNLLMYEAAIVLAASTQSCHEDGRGSRLGNSVRALLQYMKLNWTIFNSSSRSNPVFPSKQYFPFILV